MGDIKQGPNQQDHGGGGKLRPLQMEEVQMVASDRLHCNAYRLHSVITDALLGLPENKTCSS